MNKIILLIVGINIALSNYAQWDVKEIIQTPLTHAYDINIVNINGENKLYVSNNDAGVFEYQFSNNQWILTDTVIIGLNHYVTFEPGVGRNDDTTRLYISEWVNNARIYEASYRNGNWETIQIGTSSNSVTGISIGKTRNNENAVWVGGFAGISEYYWNGTDWDSQLLTSDVHPEGPGFIGDGKNNGNTNYYSPGAYVYEFEYNTNSYTESNFGTNNWPEMVAIGKGRNDGLNRIYVVDYDNTGGRKEYFYNGTSWEMHQMSTEFGRGAIFATIVKADSSTTIFANKKAGDFREYNWNGTSYDENIILDATTGATALIDAGTGRNDDTVRVYTTAYATGKILELTHEDPLVLSNTTNKQALKPTDKISIYPNPVKDYLYFNKSTPAIITIYNNKGQKCFEKTNESNKINIQSLAKGIYFLHYRSETADTVKKLIKL